MENLVKRATEFARVSHSSQKRKYTDEPYINHPFAVADILRSHVPGVSDEMLAAAMLHDVVEDTPATVDVIVKAFGFTVGKLVAELTEPAHTGNRWERKGVKEPERLSKISADAQTIKCADILANLRDMQEQDPDFFKTYSHEKQRALTLMTRAYEPLRQTAWLATLPKGEK